MTIDTSYITTVPTTAYTIPIYVNAYLEDYTGFNIHSFTLFNVDIIPTSTCDCSLLGWDAPDVSSINIGNIFAGTSAVTHSLVSPTANRSNLDPSCRDD